MGATGDESTPCPSEQFQTVLPSIFFLLMFHSFLILFGINLSLALESSPAESNNTIIESTPPVVNFRFPTVYFQRESMKLGRQAKKSLKPLIEYLKIHPAVQI